VTYQKHKKISKTQKIPKISKTQKNIENIGRGVREAGENP